MKKILRIAALSMLAVIIFGVAGCGSAPQVDTKIVKVSPERQAILDKRDRQDGNK